MSWYRWDDPRMEQYIRDKLARIASVRPSEAAELATRYLDARTEEARQIVGLEIEHRAIAARADITKAAQKRGFWG